MLAQRQAERVFRGPPHATIWSPQIHKLLIDRDPIEDERLASQPTISRIENGVGRADLHRMGMALSGTVLARHKLRLRDRAQRIILDFDPTDDPTHGQQEFSFFHGYYDTYCYLPLIGTVQVNTEKKDQRRHAYADPPEPESRRGRA